MGGESNTYLYANANPLSYVDPNGLIGLGYKEWIKYRLGPDCGSSVNNTEYLVPDFYLKTECQAHDKCYSTCGMTKKACDLNSGIGLYGFVLYLTGGGQDAYDEAQKKCDGCADE